MKIRDFPPMQSAVRDMAPLIPTLHDAFEAGTDYGRWGVERLRDIFADPSIHADSWHFPHSVRLCAKHFLTKHAGLLVDEYQLDDIAMSGLRFTYGGWNVRARKSAPGGKVPRLGGSRAMRAFCQQMLPGIEADTFSGRNLLVLWHATPAGDYTGLSIVYLADGSDSGNSAPLWRVDLASAAPMFRVPSQREQDIEAVGDLDMELDTGTDEEESGDGGFEQAGS